MLARIGSILANLPSTSVRISGWVRTVRSQKKFTFIELDDGSGKIQIVMPSEKVPPLVTGSSVEVSGSVVQGPKALEVQGDSIITLGSSDMVRKIQEYPLAKKAHSFEHLRECVHFRPRTETIAAVLRVRSESSFAIHDYFRRLGAF